MKVILDVDDTIFKTQEFLNKISGAFVSVGFKVKHFEEIYERCKKENGLFGIDAMIGYCTDLEGFDITGFRKHLEPIFSDTSGFIFKDFYDFARHIPTQNMALLSFGDRKTQETKIINSGLATLIPEVVITQTNKKTAFEENFIPRNLGKRLFFLDDKATHVNEVKEAFPEIVTAIHIQRPEGRHIAPAPTLADFTVSNLTDAKNFILSSMQQSCAPTAIPM